MSHYFLSGEHKEHAKKLLGFKSVPFYVVLNARGEITQKGPKVDLEEILGTIREKENVQQTIVEKKTADTVVKTCKVVEDENPAVVSPERLLTIDLDFDF